MKLSGDFVKRDGTTCDSYSDERDWEIHICTRRSRFYPAHWLFGVRCLTFAKHTTKEDVVRMAGGLAEAGALRVYIGTTNDEELKLLYYN